MPKADIAAQGYDLSLNRYKEVVHEEVEHRAPREILADLDEAGDGDSEGDEGAGGDGRSEREPGELARGRSWRDLRVQVWQEFAGDAIRAGGNVPVFGSNGVVGQHNESITVAPVDCCWEEGFSWRV